MEPKLDSSQSEPAAASGRLTRSRAKQLGLSLKNAPWPEIGGRNRKGKKRRLAAEDEAPNELEESLAKKKDLQQQEQQQSRRRKSVRGRVHISRFRTCPKISEHDELLLRGAPWLVHVSSTGLDGKELACSGTVVHWDKQEAWILTSYYVVFCAGEDRLYNPMPKLAIHVEKAVHLPNKGIYEGKMLFFSKRYRIALLKIEVESTIAVVPPRDGSRPTYNEKVLTLARDKRMNLWLHRATITWQEENHYFLANCKYLPDGVGGPVINHAGDMAGMSCYYKKDLAILSITTIRRCITSWTEFGCIPRAMLGMAFRTMSLLDIVRQDCLSYKYNISEGFIVDEVADNSDAEKLGIREGMVISFLDVVPSYLPEFEDYLLNIGLNYRKGTWQSNGFKLEVNDLFGKPKPKRTIILPLQITNGSEY